MTDRQKAYEEEFDGLLQEWNTEIALLTTKARKAEAEAKIECYKTVESLQGTQDASKMKL